MDELAEPNLEHLTEAWASLPTREQRVLWHHGILGVPAVTIAEAIGVPEAAVPKMLEGARMELTVRYREIIHREGPRTD